MLLCTVKMHNMAATAGTCIAQGLIAHFCTALESHNCSFHVPIWVCLKRGVPKLGGFVWLSVKTHLKRTPTQKQTSHPVSIRDSDPKTRKGGRTPHRLGRALPQLVREADGKHCLMDGFASASNMLSGSRRGMFEHKLDVRGFLGKSVTLSWLVNGQPCEISEGVH